MRIRDATQYIIIQMSIYYRNFWGSGSCAKSAGPGGGSRRGTGTVGVDDVRTGTGTVGVDDVRTGTGTTGAAGTVGFDDFRTGTGTTGAAGTVVFDDFRTRTGTTKIEVVGLVFGLGFHFFKVVRCIFSRIICYGER